MTVLSTLLKALEVRPVARNFGSRRRRVAVMPVRVVPMWMMAMVTMPKPLPRLSFGLHIRHVIHGDALRDIFGRSARVGDVLFEQSNGFIHVVRLQRGKGRYRHYRQNNVHIQRSPYSCSPLPHADDELGPVIPCPFAVMRNDPPLGQRASTHAAASAWDRSGEPRVLQVVSWPLC